VSAATKTTGRLTGNRRLRASGRHGQANGDIKQHGARIKGVVEH
jgi:uncharacterized protein YjbJ (UPF0337 family)